MDEVILATSQRSYCADLSSKEEKQRATYIYQHRCGSPSSACSGGRKQVGSFCLSTFAFHVSWLVLVSAAGRMVDI